jgi:polysaccharide deacetylase family protein (PEP-CTERM system associated)
MDPARFRDDIGRAKPLLEDVIGERILGYRAPSFSIIRETLWALDVLIEAGFLYDSSIYPIYHDLYGMRDVNPFPHEIVRVGGKILEFPLSTMRMEILKWKTIAVPISGGGYLRLFPIWVVKRGITRLHNAERQPAVLYFHPWELDPEQPRIPSTLKSRFRHYYNLGGTRGKINDLLETFRFAPMRTVLGIEDHPI